MAQPADPLDDVWRCADLLKQASGLSRIGVPVADILDGLVLRLQDDCRRILAGETVPDGLVDAAHQRAWREQ